MDQNSYITSIVNRFPGLRPVLDEHIKDNFGETLPTVFFGDVTRYVMTLLERATWGEFAPRRELKDILCYFEESYFAGDKDVQDLIVLGFLENLPNLGEEGSQIRNMLGPNLQRRLKDLFKID